MDYWYVRFFKMARGGYFAGSDWVPYTPGTLSHSTATSVQEIKKYNSKKGSKYNNIVSNKGKKHCPICNKAQDIDNSHCINCNYEFNVTNITNIKNTNQIKPKKKLFDSEFSDEELFQLFKNNFSKSDFIKWDNEYIPKPHKSKLERFYDDFHDICFSRLLIKENESIYYFSDKKERSPKLMLFFNENTIKSNFKLYNQEVLVMLRITKINEIKKSFKLRYASKNKKSKLFYLFLGDLIEDNIFENLELLINEFIDYIENPLLKNYEYYEKLDLSDFIN